jgi:outer membrane immunogenic protein
MSRHLLLGAASAAALALMIPAAQAADLPAYEPAPEVAAPLPGFTWSGPYVGAQTGYSWGRASNTKYNGWQVGGFAGYNFQFDNSPVVVGLETDFNWADIDGNRRGGGFGTKLQSDWNGATRVRLGYAFDRILVYGAGGVAYSDREFRRFGDKDTKTAFGWTVGGGVEAAVSDNVTIRGEYRYTDYGKDKFKVGGASYKSSYTDHKALVGVAYKFTSPW